MGTHKIHADLDVDGEVKGTSLDINGNADISGTTAMGGNTLINAQLAVNSTSVNAANKLEVHGQARVNGTMMIGDSSISNTTSTGQLHIKNTGGAVIRLEDSDNSNLAFDLISDEGVGFVIKETVGGDSGDDIRLTIAETTGDATFGGNVLIPSNLQHVGDDNNEISFGTDTQDFRTNNVSRLDISNSGVRFGGTGARVTTIENNDSLGTSDTKLATQGNIKAYVDSAVSSAGGGDVTLSGAQTFTGAKTFNAATQFSNTVTVGADTSGHDVKFFGNATGEYMQWDESTSKLNIRHDTNDSGLTIFTVGSALMTQPQIQIGRDSGQYWGVYVDDSNAYMVHRQDETGGTMTTKFDQWDSNTSDTTGQWLWRFGDGTGGNMATALTLTQASVLTATTFSGDLNGTINTATTATTQSASDNSTKVATTAYVDAQVATVVDSAPGALNTLNELAAALGDDASFSTTVTNSIAAKLPLAGGTMTGDLTISKSVGDSVLIIESDTDNNDENDNPRLEFKQDGGAVFMHAGTAGNVNVPFTNALVNHGYLRSSTGLQLVVNSTTSAITIDSSANATFAGTIGSGAITSTGKITGTELEGTSLDINGDADISGTLSGNFVVRSTNNSNVDGANFAVDTTNKSSAEYAYEVLRSGTTVAGITMVGKITGTELEGTSLDINGNADISGDLTGVDTLTATTLSVTNYGLASGDIPNNAADTSGNAATATTAGTVTTAAQGNITSVGTLTSLTVSGNINANGNIVGDDGTAITNITSIGADSYGADADSSTRFDMTASDINCLVQDTDVFQVTETDFVFDGAIKTSIKKRKFAKTTNTDGNADGDIVYFGNTTSMDTGKIYYFTSSGTWSLADADAESTAKGMLGVALGSASNTNGVLIRGMVTLDHDPGTVGHTLFLHTTAGQATITAPSGSGDIVRVIGYLLDSTNGQIYFNPDGAFVEVA